MGTPRVKGFNPGAHSQLLVDVDRPALRTGYTRDLRTVGLVLGHAASEGDVSAGYVPDRARLRALRPLYENRERDLKQLAGLEEANDPWHG